MADFQTLIRYYSSKIQFFCSYFAVPQLQGIFHPLAKFITFILFTFVLGKSAIIFQTVTLILCCDYLTYSSVRYPSENMTLNIKLVRF